MSPFLPSPVHLSHATSTHSLFHHCHSIFHLYVPSVQVVPCLVFLFPVLQPTLVLLFPLILNPVAAVPVVPVPIPIPVLVTKEEVVTEEEEDEEEIEEKTSPSTHLLFLTAHPPPQPSNLHPSSPFGPGTQVMS